MSNPKPPEGKFRIFIDDNAHYMDEDERRSGGSYDDCESAVAACKQIVNRSLEEHFQAGMTAEQLLSQYKSFGEDPWISSSDEGCKFSAWDYAEQRSKEMCKH
ncbi:MAG: hypothetical protein PHX83_08890 [Acidobacteriia bacterium]|nr:hypothetical protein [Terriglobia bacterium]